jgi:hypothetical protein
MYISSKIVTEGFMKWADALDPERLSDARAGAGEGVVIAAPSIAQVVARPTEQHSPWLVPGAGRL